MADDTGADAEDIQSCIQRARYFALKEDIRVIISFFPLYTPFHFNLTTISNQDPRKINIGHVEQLVSISNVISAVVTFLKA